MTKLRVLSFAVSLDGYGAGPSQDRDNPLGKGGQVLLDWQRVTKFFRERHGATGGTAGGIDEKYVQWGFENIGAWILGRNMFSPVRGPWPDNDWKGWWGPNPPFNTPVYILTHYKRPDLEMEGGTTFRFVTDGIESALKQAREAANGKDVRLGGGVATIREYLNAGLVDEMHLAIAPIILGNGENLLSGIDLPKLGFRVAEHIPSAAVTHVLLRK